MKKIISFIILSISLLHMQAQQNLSLSDAIAIGLENNYNLKMQQSTEKIAEINNTWGNTSFMPTIGFTAAANENFNYNNTENYRQQTLVPDLSLNWVFFDGFSARINKQTFEELEKQSEGNTAILVENTIQDIILAYHNCLLQNEMVEVYKELAELSEDRYQRTEFSKTLGAGTSYESLQAKTSWLEDKSNFLQQKVTYDNTVRTLNFALAVDNNTNWNFSGNLDIIAPDYQLDMLAEKMMSNNHTLNNQYLYQSLRAKETALAKSEYLPTLSLNTGIKNTDMGQYYKQNTANVYQNYSDAYVGITLSWGIFNGGTRKRSVEIAKVNEEISTVETAQIEHSLNNQLLQMYSNYNVQKTILTLAQEQEASARLNLELSAEKLKNGNINSFNYRDVQIAYMNASISRFRAIYNLLESNTDLLRITGGIVDEYE